MSDQDEGGRPALTAMWPLFGLRLVTPRLELSVPLDADLIEMIVLARGGIHDPAVMPFSVPWTDRPSPRFEMAFAQYHWQQRAEWSPSAWALTLMARSAGVCVGAQGLSASDFATRRTVATGSWLGREHQGHGLGREMRAAVLDLAFRGLGAEHAVSTAFLDNSASAAVSAALGYEADGIEIMAPRGEPREARRYRLHRQTWLARPQPAVTVEGLDACRSLFGA